MSELVSRDIKAIETLSFMSPAPMSIAELKEVFNLSYPFQVVKVVDLGPVSGWVHISIGTTVTVLGPSIDKQGFTILDIGRVTPENRPQWSLGGKHV